MLVVVAFASAKCGSWCWVKGQLNEEAGRYRYEIGTLHGVLIPFHVPT